MTLFTELKAYVDGKIASLSISEENEHHIDKFVRNSYLTGYVDVRTEIRYYEHLFGTDEYKIVNRVLKSVNWRLTFLENEYRKDALRDIIIFILERTNKMSYAERIKYFKEEK